MSAGTTPVLRRALTATPLARRHERDIKLRVRQPIPFDSFDPSAYPAAAVAMARDLFHSLALGELMAVDLFAKLAAALTLAGAPLDVIAAAARVPGDEIRHADIALRMASILAGSDVSIEIDPQRHAAYAGPLSAEELDVAMIQMSAIGEALACALISACREQATDPVLRAVFSALLQDEVHHTRLGWYYLAWRAPQWDLAEKQRVADRTGEFVIRVEEMFARGRDAPRGARKASRALGVLDTKAQRTAIVRVMDEEIVPGLDGLGLGASHAWRARQKSSG